MEQLTPAEQEELDAFQGFVDLLGLTEMDDSDFTRYLELLDRLRPSDPRPNDPRGAEHERSKLMDKITSFTGEHRFLSTFHPTPHITWGGIVFPTVEHAYQAAKTLDLAARQRIANLSHPGQAKRWGRRLALRPHWDSIRLDVMHELLQLKFAPRSEMAHRLLTTEDAELVHGNTWGDRFWGVCDGQGENQLGLLLMAIRYDLQSR